MPRIISARPDFASPADRRVDHSFELCAPAAGSALAITRRVR